LKSVFTSIAIVIFPEPSIAFPLSFMCCVCDLFYAELHKTFAIAWLVLRMGSELRLIYIHYRHTHNPVAPPPSPMPRPSGS